MLRSPGKGSRRQILERLEVDPAAACKARPRLARPLAQVGHRRHTDLSHAPRGPQVLQAAVGEADRLNDEYVGVEHLLIAIASEGSGDAARILKEFGIDQEKIYQALLEHPRQPPRR